MTPATPAFQAPLGSGADAAEDQQIHILLSTTVEGIVVGRLFGINLYDKSVKIGIN